jgi:predicted TIM-barrel fold metal-dependent hydrolase
MLRIDAQVHVYERKHFGNPARAPLHGPPEVTGRDMVTAMDAAGVDGAILVSPNSIYGFDARYAQQVRSQFPMRFGMIKPVDPTDPAVSDTVAEWASTPGALGVRLMLPDASSNLDDPGINLTMSAAARHNLPINVRAAGRLEQLAGLAAVHPETTIVVDHLGLAQPSKPPVPPDGWANLPKLMRLAEFPNVLVKLTGAFTLSCEAYPFRDVWDPLLRVLDQFGCARCMWGTDWTRALSFLTYEEAVSAFEELPGLSKSDRVALMGGTLIKTYSWKPSQAATTSL